MTLDSSALSVNKHTRLCLRWTKSAAAAAKGRGGCLVQSRMIHGDPEDVLVAFWLDIQKSKALKIGLQTTKESSPQFVSNF